jgi:hypothetical protein
MYPPKIQKKKKKKKMSMSSKDQEKGKSDPKYFSIRQKCTYKVEK